MTKIFVKRLQHDQTQAEADRNVNNLQ